MLESTVLDWERDGADWPNREASSFIDADGLRWHVQRGGSGPDALLLHGTGAATHSWRGLFPKLVNDFSVLAPDFPGHGFTAKPRNNQFSLPAMAVAVSDLLRTLNVSPELVVAHSAGAAVAIRMALDGTIAPKLIVCLNGALFPFQGMASQFFSPLAKLLVVNPLVPRLFAWGASGSVSVEKLIRDTGSEIEPEGIALYQKLMQNPAHVSGALRMMASWDLHALQKDLPKLRLPLFLIASERDRAIPSDQAFAVRDVLPGAKVEYLRGAGHLAHEEKPDEIARMIVDVARQHGILSA